VSLAAIGRIVTSVPSDRTWRVTIVTSVTPVTAGVSAGRHT
jgi:hypothetical protein